MLIDGEFIEFLECNSEQQKYFAKVGITILQYRIYFKPSVIIEGVSSSLFYDFIRGF
jgi:hypothetical protein